MKKKIYSAVIVLSFAFPALTVAASENNAEVHGTIELGVQGGNTTGDEARFQEFRDMEDGVIGGVQLDVVKDAYHLEMDAKNPGADDQSFQFEGGEYGNFKYKFNYSEMPHNYTFDAITPATGIGTSNIDIPAPLPGAEWTHFDYKVNHQSYGGELTLAFHSPYYVTVGVERREQDGLRPYSVKQPAEVPEPIATTTDNLNMKVGYAGKTFSASVSGLLSSFENDHKYMLWGDPDNATTDLVVFSPDNDYKKVAADLSWRGLPLQSMVAVSGSYSHLTNSYSASDIGFPTATGVNTTIASDTIVAALITNTGLRFEGDIDYSTVSIALSSSPLAKLDSKIYYRYLKRDDNSSHIYYDATHDNAGELLSYDKDTAGIDLDYRLPLKTKLEAGYEYLKMDRSTPEGEGIPTSATTDNSFYVGAKNSSLDWMTAKLRYKHLTRDSDDLEAPTPFYYQDQTSNAWELGFDFYPMDRLDLGLDFAYKNTDYDYAKDTRTDDTRKSVYVDAAWHVTGKAALRGFVGFEKVETDANRVTNNDPTPVFAQTIDDDFWTYGLAVNMAATDQLTLNVSWQYQKSDGSVEFDNSLTGTAYEDISKSDDYTKKKLEAEVTYAVDPQLGLTVGYIYEKLAYSDINYANYANVLGTTYYYSGLYADPNYEANIGYLMVKYGF